MRLFTISDLPPFDQHNHRNLGLLFQFVRKNEPVSVLQVLKSSFVTTTEKLWFANQPGFLDHEIATAWMAVVASRLKATYGDMTPYIVSRAVRHAHDGRTSNACDWAEQAAINATPSWSTSPWGREVCAKRERERLVQDLVDVFRVADSNDF